MNDKISCRTEIERHNLNEALQNYNPLNQVTNHHVFPVSQVQQHDPLSPIDPMHYSVPLPNFSNNQLTVQTDSSANNGVFGWFQGLGQNIQNAFRPPPPGVNQQNPNPGSNPGPLSSIFRPITNFFNGNPDQNAINSNNNNNQGGLFGFFQNIPFIGGNNAQNNPNYNNVEQFSPVQAAPLPPIPSSGVSIATQTNNNDYYDYDIPIIRPLAVNNYKPQVMPGYDTTQHTYSNLLRTPPMIPIAIGSPMMMGIPGELAPNDLNQDGWFKKMVKRRRLQQQLKKEAKKEIKAANKKIMQTVATPGFGS